MKKILILILGLTTLLSCKTKKCCVKNNKQSSALIGEFTVVSMGGVMVNDFNPTLNFDGEKVSGFSGCNTYFGTVVSKNDSLSLKGLIRKVNLA